MAPTNMRIVALADTHTFESEFASPIPDGDVFIHAGDLLREGTLEELASVAPWLQSLSHPTKLVIAGNHDVCFQTHREEACQILGPTVRYLEDEVIQLEGITFWGSPWTPRFHDWAFMLERGETIRQKWRKIPDNVDILITHGPPKGIGDTVGGFGHMGCTELAEEMKRIQPLLHLFGHSHPCGGLYFKDGINFVNVTSWECERGPTVFDIAPSTKLIQFVDIPRGDLYESS